MNSLNNIIVTNIERLITVSSPKGKIQQVKDRRCYGLSFCKEGQITYTHKGQKYVSDPWHAIILPQGESYSLHGDKSGVFPLINFSCADKLCDTMLLLPVRDIDTYIKDYEQMKSLFLFDRNRAKVMSIFYNILHRLSFDYNSEPNILIPAIRYIESNYTSSSLTNKELANKCNISEIYFRKLFAKSYGLSPKQFIIDIRINKAKQLLTDSILKINAVSEECGFSNPYHFCRIFKQKVGLTPTEYMKQNRIYKI